jgi:Protein involved in formate dehydrogenase formation
MKLAIRGGPARFDERLKRCESLLSGSAAPSATEPLTTLAAVLAHQGQRVADSSVRAAAESLATDAAAAAATGRFPMFDATAALGCLSAELSVAVDALALGPLPRMLAEAGRAIVARPAPERLQTIEAWLDDAEMVDPPHGFWIRVASAAVFELAAATLDVPIPDDWRGAACPICGGAPQVSLIAEESGEFMGGAPRTLVCGRCASWWPYPRITCALCGEEDPQRINAFVAADSRVARVDTCETCHSYIKTFDLRAPGAKGVLPLVDDVATLVLDLWAQERGFTRPTLSFAGV